MSNHDERRKLPRRRTRLSAVVLASEGADAPLSCVIRDKNDLGAKLLMQAGSVAPDLCRVLELSSGDLYAARVVWRDAAFVGVAYDGEPVSLPQSRAPELQAEKALWSKMSGR